MQNPWESVQNSKGGSNHKQHSLGDEVSVRIMKWLVGHSGGEVSFACGTQKGTLQGDGIKLNNKIS